ALTPEFRFAAVPEREDPRDVLVTRDGASIADLPKSARLGTSSLRRRFQALRINSRVQIVPLRGNVDTRLQRLAAGEMDAIIIAMAGLKRLGRAADVVFTPLDERDFIPAGGQAALAVEALAATDFPRNLERALSALNDPRARFETSAERGFLAAIGASCATPVGVKAGTANDSLTVRAILFSGDGTEEMADNTTEPLDAD